MGKFLQIILFIFLAVGACKKGDNEIIIVSPPDENTTETDGYNLDDMRFINVSPFIIGFSKDIDESDNSIVDLKDQIRVLTDFIPSKGISLIADDTIRIFTNEGQNGYISANQRSNFAGSIVIGNKNDFTSSGDTLRLWNWFAELVQDKYLTSTQVNSLNGLYQQAKNGQYREVYHFNGTRLLKNKVGNPPATTSVGMYLSALLKSCFAQNDYYPFVYEELERFDEEGKDFVTDIFGERRSVAHPDGITMPPSDFTQWVDVVDGVVHTGEVPLDLWYSKYILAASVDGVHHIPILASRFVSDSGVLQAKYIVEKMISKLPDYALSWMEANHYRLGVIGAWEDVTDLPEARAMPVWWPDTDWDDRGRGYGATTSIPLMTCGEENLVFTPASPFAKRYPSESIMVHEFAHNIDQGLRERGSGNTEGAQFESDLLETFAHAKDVGLWKGTYSMTNSEEYWAEGVQAWFNTCRMVVPDKDGDFMLKYREQLLDYDPMLYQLIEKYFAVENLRGYHFDFE